MSAVLIVGLPSAQAMAADGWGSSWSFGPTTSRIIHARTTMVPGRLPPITSTTGPLFLWPGMSNPTSDLIQTTMDAWPDNKGYCGAGTGQWCVEASVFGSFGQRNGPTVAIDPDDHVTIDYLLGADNNTWTQTVTSMKLGKVVSTLQSTSGEMPKGGFGFATEADANSYTIDTQYYLCTEIDLAAADPHFGATGVGGVGAQYGATGTGSGIGTAKNLRTPDSGLTWLVDLITLPAMQPQGTQTAAPAIDCSETADAGGSSSGSTTSTASGSTAGSTSHASTASGTGSTTSASTGSTAGSETASSSRTGSGEATGSSSAAESTGAGGTTASNGSSSRAGTSARGSASSSEDTSGESAANPSEAKGCSCAAVGSNTRTAAGLSPIALGMAAALIRRRRTHRKS